MNLPVNVLLVAFASAISAFAQWLIVVFLGRLEGPAVLGSYSLAQSWVLVISYLTMLAFRQQILAGNFRDYSFFSLLLVRFAFSFLVFIPCVFAVWYFSDHSFLVLFVCAVFYKFSDLLIDLVSAWYQQAKRFFLLAGASVVRLAFVLSFFLAAYYADLGLVAAFGSMLIGAIVFFVFVDFRFLNLRFVDFYSDFSLSFFYEIVRDNFLFAASNVLMVLAFALLRQLVDYFSGSIVLGYFSASFQIVTLISFFVTAAGQVLLPRFGDYYRLGAWVNFRSLLFKVLTLFFVFGVLLSAFVFYFGADIIVLIYGSKFKEGYQIMVLVFLSSIPMFLASVVGASAYAVGSKSIMLKAYMFTLLLLFVLGALGGYFVGVNGVLSAFSVVMIFQVFYFYFSIRIAMKAN